MKISKVIETIDNVNIEELYELIKMGFVDSFTSEEEIIGKDGYYKGRRNCKQLDPEANETEGLDWYSSLSKEERAQLKKMYKALMKK